MFSCKDSVFLFLNKMLLACVNVLFFLSLAYCYSPSENIQKGISAPKTAVAC